MRLQRVMEAQTRLGRDKRDGFFFVFDPKQRRVRTEDDHVNFAVISDKIS